MSSPPPTGPRGIVEPIGNRHCCTAADRHLPERLGCIETNRPPIRREERPATFFGPRHLDGAQLINGTEPETSVRHIDDLGAVGRDRHRGATPEAKGLVGRQRYREASNLAGCGAGRVRLHSASPPAASDASNATARVTGRCRSQTGSVKAAPGSAGALAVVSNVPFIAKRTSPMSRRRSFGSLTRHCRTTERT